MELQTLMKEEFINVIARLLLALMVLINVACVGRESGSDQWQPVKTVPGALRRNLVGDNSQPGPYKYQLRIPAGARAAVHKHSVDVQVRVLSGSMFIIIGEPLDASRVQHFVTGNVFVVPKNTWHDEWWDKESVLEAEGVGPSETVYKNQ
jgi:hypothetical protein